MATRKSEKNNSETKYRFSMAIIILLVIVIIWLLLVNIFGFKSNRIEKIHIFDLSYCQTCGNANVPETGDDNTNQNQQEGGKQESSDVSGNITVFDSDATWNMESQLRIFEDSLYDDRNLIAPHSTNTYEFIVRNRTGATLDYNIAFEEYNPNNINMKYRLVKDGKYVAGDKKTWVTFSELNQAMRTIHTDTNDTYYLEWQWFDSDNDTEIGETNNAEYQIKINIKATQVINAE